MKQKVAVARTVKAEYPREAPYDPSERFPEYPFDRISNDENYVYVQVRELFRLLGCDIDNYNTPGWNPLGLLIEPGMTVLLKPNFVRSRHYEEKDPYAMITHPSVIRAVADYVWVALRGEGMIIIADAPQYDGNWQELMELTGLERVRDLYNNKREGACEIRDLRNYWSRKRHFPSMLIDLPGDPAGSVRINLGKESAVCEVADPKLLYGAVYHRQETVQNHSGERQIYELSGTVLNADVVISIPKLKTHKKVGVTLNIKGLVGASTNKNLIVHYSLGSHKDGGDQYPPNHFTPMEERIIKTERWMYDTFLAKRSVPLEYIHRSIYWLHGKLLKPLGVGVEKKKRVLDVGNWYGNDSAWRMAVDLLKIIVFCDACGKLHKQPQRRLFSVIDGIIGGDNRGPLEPDPVGAGLLIASGNYLAADIVATRMMGFDPLKVKTLNYLLNEEGWDYGVRDLEEIEVVANDGEVRNCLSDKKNRFAAFRPHPGWVGHLEI